MKRNETAVFGGGCFWCTEAVFSRLKGVINVLPGYAGGKMENPTYEVVSGGQTGHTEVVKIEYDPQEITYNNLLEVFWALHDPTTLNRQGPDIGTQYRSIILYANNQQKQEAEKSKEKQIKSAKFKKPIVTEIQPLDKFYTAEEYHKQYFDKNPGLPYCQLVIQPKISKLIHQFSSLVK